MNILLLALLFVAGTVGVVAQNDTGFPEPVRDDTVCFSYRFMAGDRIVYRVVSQDSIYFKEQPPLTKERAERMEIVCDSVGANGHFYLRQTLVDYIAKESLGDMKDVVRTESPWTGRVALLELDSLGRRYERPQPANRASALTPGGAFQPHLLVGIYDSCKNVHQSWMIDREEEVIAENGSPAPVRVQTSLYDAFPMTDTLGFACLEFHHALTGQGFITVTDIKTPMRIVAVLSGNGEMKLSDEHRVPVHYKAGAQIKMEITTADGKLVKGTQYINTNYTIEEFYRNGITITQSAPAREPKKTPTSPKKKK